MSELTDWLNALGDHTRLRILRLLEKEELGVGEIARVVQLPQSTVSRQLKTLSESGWLVKRAVGPASMYRFVGESIDEDARQLWIIARNRLARTGAFADDAERLRHVLAERATDSRAFFGRIGGDWDALRQDLFGDRFTAEALLALVDPQWTVADLGCGTGNASEVLAPLVKHVIAIDREKSMLDASRKRLRAFKNVEFREGDLEDLPLKNGEVDAALALLVLHHLEEPKIAVKEIARSLKGDGIVMIVDMIAHDRDAYRHTMGHVHLGFSEADIKSWAKHAGLKSPRYVRLRPDTESKGPSLFVATMRK